VLFGCNLRGDRMRYKNQKTIYLLIILVLGFCFAQNETGVEVVETFAPPNQGKQVFVRIANNITNLDMYLLYTHPAPPYLTDDGVIMVSWDDIGLLLGASDRTRGEIGEPTWSIDAKNKTATMERAGIVLKIKNDHAEVSGNATKEHKFDESLTDYLVWFENENALLAPLQIITSALEIGSNWDPVLNIYSSTDSLNLSGIFTNIYLPSAIAKGGGYNTKAIIPVKLEASQVKVGDSTIDSQQIRVTFKKVADIDLDNFRIRFFFMIDGGFYWADLFRDEESSCFITEKDTITCELLITNDYFSPHAPLSQVFVEIIAKPTYTTKSFED
jgi:hypothetical protein